jgi:four helix bundle protein
MTKKQYDLEDRTLKFARNVVSFCKKLPKSVIDGDIARQLVRAATSVGANYIEANEALGKKDFLMRIKICRKEAKEGGYWLRLLEINNPLLREEQEQLLQEAAELTKIFSSIVTKSQ